MEHIRELRARIIRSALAVGICFIIAWVFRGDLLYVLKKPLLDALAANPQAPHGVLLLKVMEKFFVHLKVALFGGLVLAAPYVIYQAWRFIDPAFYAHERKLALPFVLSSLFLFALGLSFCYFIMLPFAFNFLIHYSLDTSPGLLLPVFGVKTGRDTLQIALSDHISLTIKLLLGFGFAFETPLFIAMVSATRIASWKWFSKRRGYALVILAVLSAVLTPQDPWSMLMMFGPLWALYEIGIILAWIISRKREDSDDEKKDDKEKENKKNKKERPDTDESGPVG
ncbi:MAG: twin-arginine translocase subunit TatC [Deltaproteobacteria bacterium]|nr:twin-arginine translocase subunit TatC [Deltaproteobacteria bacterium]